MIDAGKRIIAGAQEALAYARGHKAALATLTPGSTWTTEDGVEVMVVPVEATEEMLDHGFKARFYGTLGQTWSAMLSAIRKE